jgi:cellulose synthase/poly-beta-1,6-N-acetylglucosamine synthase-like glycosyltransferase
MSWYEVRAAMRRRRGVPTLLDMWPTVSIIVPAFNEATRIENCVRSIQLTSYDRYEVVLVDDGSADNTFELMKGVAAADLRIKVLSQANLGRGAALTLGLRHAAGEIVMFMDADLVLSRNTVKRVLQGFADERTGAVFGDARPATLNPKRPRILASLGRGAGLLRRAVAVSACLPGRAGNIRAVSRTVLEEIGPVPHDLWGGDLELTRRVRRAGYRVAFAPRDLACADTSVTTAGDRFRRSSTRN